MEERLRGDIFEGLKRALKARRMTYADLAERLGVSEPTIKRIFAERDCKMGRLLRLCDLLGVSLADLVERAERSADAPVELPQHVEAEMAADPPVFYLFILLREGVPEDEIKERYGLSERDLFLSLLRLERLGLARTGDDGRIRVLKDPPVRFRRHGPLHRPIRDINTQFVGEVFDSADRDDASFRTMSRRMLPDTALAAHRELAELCDRINTMARQDQLIAPERDLKTYKLSAAFGPVHFPRIIDFPGSEE